ncbi:MAG: SRPBCC domain-containing protein [Bradyrhizobium sp.]|nr:SRPBCC domain-containing protein [Bradyrhizobium sp.]
MKFRQEFDVNEQVARVWAFFAQTDRVAACIPGVENVEVLDPDTFIVLATQKVGPIGATFESRVNITERVHEQKIKFTSTGKAVRGAVGNFRATNTVFLEPAGDRTHVVVEGEAALAGMLGSVGQKIINKQADRVTAEFASNLEKVFWGDGASAPPALGTTTLASSPTSLSNPSATPRAPVFPIAPAVVAPANDVATTIAVAAATAAAAAVAVIQRSDLWAKISALLSGLALVVGLLILWWIGMPAK